MPAGGEAMTAEARGSDEGGALVVAHYRLDD